MYSITSSISASGKSTVFRVIDHSGVVVFKAGTKLETAEAWIAANTEIAEITTAATITTTPTCTTDMSNLLATTTTPTTLPTTTARPQDLGITIIQAAISIALATAVVFVGCYRLTAWVYNTLKTNRHTAATIENLDELAESVIAEKLEQISTIITVTAHATSVTLHTVQTTIPYINTAFHTYYQVIRSIRPAIAALKATESTAIAFIYSHI
jgi:hypothetical protein